jgi:glycosyltransferase involved in cell wall biosynthesis
MKIIGIPRQWEGGGYYRIRQPLEELAYHGHEIVCEAVKSNVGSDGADVIVGQFIGGHGIRDESNSVTDVQLVHRWWRGLSRDCRLVYELDDDPFQVEPHNQFYHHYMNPFAFDSITHCIQIADLVTVSTPMLAERICEINPNVVVLQNRIDESLLSMERPRRGRITIGWAGSHSHLHDIELCAYGLRRTLDRNNNVDAHFVGADYRSIIARPMRHTQWCINTVDYYKLIDFDIGLAPLLETRFAETKSHIKALEYAALGIPVIASDSAPYRDFVIDGVTGFLVRKEHEWAVRMRELINDEAMREEMGAKAREVASQWTIQKVWPEWEAAYEGIV